MGTNAVAVGTSSIQCRPVTPKPEAEATDLHPKQVFAGGSFLGRNGVGLGIKPKGRQRPMLAGASIHAVVIVGGEANDPPEHL
jgi:hypothetical protein